MSIPLVRPTLRRRDFNSVLSCMVSDRIGPGALNRQLAAELCAFTGTSGGACLATYRSTLQAAFRVLELEPGDPVIISALAPQEYLEALRLQGLTALVADVEPRRPTLSLQQVDSHVKAGAKAIVLHHSLGFSPAGEELTQTGLPVIEDVTQALGGKWGDSPCGSVGTVAVIALEPQGIVTAGCGGVVFSRDRKLAKAIQGLCDGPLHSLLLPDMNAALGIAQLKEISRFLRVRGEIAELFFRSLQKSRHVALVSPGAVDGPAENVNYSFPVLVREGLREVRQYAAKKNVDTEPAFRDSIIALQAAAGGQPPAARGAEAPAEAAADREAAGEPLREAGEKAHPNARDLLWRCLLFPLYPSLARKDVQLVSKVLSTLP